MILAGKKKYFFIALRFLFCLFLVNCKSSSELKKITIEGPTMGTKYRIVVKTDKNIKSETISNKAEEILKAVNNQMSTYIPHSEISKFNISNQDDFSMEISEEFFSVLEKSFFYNEKSYGKFDITVNSLYELWRFKNKTSEFYNKEPSVIEIDSTLDFIGMDKIELDPKRKMISKTDGEVSIDLSAIAKGYAVDKISDYLKSQGYDNFLVDIGGEIKVGSAYGEFWEIGIQYPDRRRIGEAVKMVRLSNNSLATSGNYANFINYLDSNKDRTHIIDPETGYPLEIKEGIIASASVIANDCVDADALATILMLLDKKRGLELIESLENVEAYVTYFKDDKLYFDQSSGFEKYTVTGN